LKRPRLFAAIDVKNAYNRPKQGQILTFDV
jgi:hypothetical protein